MNSDEPPKDNELVQATRMAGIAAKEGNMEKLKECAQEIGKAGAVISKLSREKEVGDKPSQLSQLTKKAGNQGDANQRDITIDKPPPGHAR